jgi:uncharacterized protein YcfL
MNKALFLLLVATLAGCSSPPRVTASTPRSLVIDGSYWTDADNQAAFKLAESECQKQNRHAAFAKVSGTKGSTQWNFDCVN